MNRLCLCGLGGVFLLTLLASPAPAQKEDPKDKNSVPVWTMPSLQDRQSLGKTTRQLEDGVFLVGQEKGSFGTAWVISRKHRLLISNAHVADIMHPSAKMVAIINGLTHRYTVEKAWYHPGVRRLVKGASIRSIDPKTGPVDPRSPDLAVLLLGPGGPDLPTELAMATPEEIKNLRYQAVAMLGFPGHDTKGLPPSGKKPQATFHDGMISRLSNFQLDASVPEGELQFLQYTMADWGGFSGSPVYLPNGHVVGVHNMARSEKGSFGDIRVIPHGIRLDCVWELLTHHKLLDKVAAKIDTASLNLKRWLVDDERDVLFQKALTLLDEARYLVYTKEDFAKGIEVCTAAMKLVPSYGEPYLVRSHAFTNTWFNFRRKLDNEASKKLLLAALADGLQYKEIVGPSSPEPHINYCTTLNNLGAFTRDNKYNREALQILSNVLKVESLSKFNRANCLSGMGVALDNLGDNDEALKKHTEAVRLTPDQAHLWEARAEFYHYNKQFRMAQSFEKSDRARAKLLREKRYPLAVTWNVILNAPNQLAANDPQGRVRKGAHYKVHTVKLEKGITYQIELISDDVDTYLRLEDPKGNRIMDDDDSGGNLDAMVYFVPPETGVYRIVATTFNPNETGSYTVKVQEGR